MGYDPLAFRYLTFQTRYRSEMDFSEDAMRTADTHVRELRRDVAGWGEPVEPTSDAAKQLDERFREAVSDDLNMPQALVVLNQTVRSSDVADAEKAALLRSWDRVLGLDLDRDAREGFTPTEEMDSLVRERDEARAAKDYAKSDQLRERLQAMGLEVMDTPQGTTIRPRI
jgi:cysteinyl-tRNA synthetase